MSTLSAQLEDLSGALAEALSAQNPNLLRATAALVAEQLQKISAPAALELERPCYLLVHTEQESEIVPIDLRGIIPHKGKVS